MRNGSHPICRSCGAKLIHTFVDLGMSPLANSYVTSAQLSRMEPFYPLHVRVCASCFLVQLPAVVSPQDLFSEYAYFSSYSDSWLEHAKAYTEAVTKRFGLNHRSWEGAAAGDSDRSSILWRRHGLSPGCRREACGSDHWQ